MPLIATLHHGDLCTTYLWRIDEKVDYFEQTLSDQDLDLSVVNGWHPTRQLEWLAGRHLVNIFVESPISELLVMPTGKPYFPGQEEYFSISHSGKYAGLSVSSSEVGLDIQKQSDKMERLSRKFLHNDDIRNSPYDRNSSLHYVWSAKEAMFKSYGKGQVDFQNHMRIEFKDDHLRGILNNEKDRISFELQHYYINDHYIVVALQQD